ncbi:MAG: alkene reductase [Kiloniellales bacterium]|nr:alkene reductase [Kiloniellales bacterium]
MPKDQIEKGQTEAAVLFRPGRLGALTLPNRVIMAPLTRNRTGRDGVPGPLNVEYYRQRASAGLIITEATDISPQARGYPDTPGIHSRDQVEGWRRVTEAVHAAGGRIFLQILHTGRISHASLQPGGARPVAPSAIRPAGEAMTYDGLQPFGTPRALETQEITGIVADFRRAAENAEAAGFDGVEIHAANGYLLDQFLRDGSNRRDDAYGGSVENRARLLLEVVSAAAEVLGAGRVGVRLSPLNSFNDIRDGDPQGTFLRVAGLLAPMGLAYLHVVEGDMTGQENAELDHGRLREAFGGPYIANNGYDRSRAIEAIAGGQADFVAFGSLFLANPDLPERFRRDAPLNTPIRETFYGGDGRGYTDYPFLEEGTLSAA